MTKKCEDGSEVSLWGATKSIFKMVGCGLNAAAKATEAASQSMNKASQEMAQNAHLARLERAREYLARMGYTETEIASVDIEDAADIIINNLIFRKGSKEYVDLNVFIGRSSQPKLFEGLTVQEILQKLPKKKD